MFGIHRTKKRLLNLDESFLSFSDLRRMRWQYKGAPNTKAHLQFSPRITVIAGLDSDGRVYLSLLQANSNEDTMRLFFEHLVRVLDHQDGNWRDTTVIVLDNGKSPQAMRLA